MGLNSFWTSRKNDCSCHDAYQVYQAYPQSLFHFMKNTQDYVAGLSWRRSGVIISGIGKHPASLWKPLFVMKTSFILTSELKSLRFCRKYWKSFSVKNQERISESPIAGIRIKMKRPKKRRVKCAQHEFDRETCQLVILLFLLKIYSDALPFLESCGHGGKDFSAPPVSA